LSEKKSPKQVGAKSKKEVNREENENVLKSQTSQKTAKSKISKIDKALLKINQEVNTDQNVSEDATMLVTFSVGSEEYAIAIDMIKEVVVAPRIAPVPQAPSYICGVANVRGHVLAVLDLGIKFGLYKAESEGSLASVAYVMVTKDDEYQIAVAVNKIPDTLMVSNSDIDKSGAMIKSSTQNQDYITGIVKVNNRMIIMIDIHQMIRSEYTNSTNLK